MDTQELNYLAVLESNSLRMPNVTFVSPTLFFRFKGWLLIPF